MRLVIGNKRYSSWSFRPWLALKAAGIPFTEIFIPIGKKDFDKKLSKFSPAGKVPVLADGAIRVWESLAICEYAAEKFPAKKLWPENKEARALARAISSEMHAGFQGLRQNLPCHFLNRYKNFQVPDAAKNDIARIQEIWKDCRKKWGKGGAFLFGKFSIADAMYAPVVFRFLAYGVKVDAVCRDYMKAIETMPATREWVRGAEKETERIEKYEFQR